MTQILRASPEVHYRCNGISSNLCSSFQIVSLVLYSVVLYAVLVCLLFQYNSYDCIWLLVATVCSNESTLSLQPRAKRLQMIVGNLARASQAQ